MSEELKPCPFCGEKIEPPKSRQASTDRSEGFVAFAACYCGGYSATAHKMGRGNTEAEAIQEVIALWNRRARPAEADGPSFAEVLEQASVIQQLGAKNKRIDELISAPSAVTAERDRLESMLIRTTTRHFAQQWKDRTDDKKLDECLSEGIAMLEAERDQLRAELEALRKEAERYRWLRDQAPKARGEWEIDGQRYGMMLGVDQDDVDQAVDALMSAMSAKEA